MESIINNINLTFYIQTCNDNNNLKNKINASDIYHLIFRRESNS